MVPFVNCHSHLFTVVVSLSYSSSLYIQALRSCYFKWIHCLYLYFHCILESYIMCVFFWCRILPCSGRCPLYTLLSKPSWEGLGPTFRKPRLQILYATRPMRERHELLCGSVMGDWQAQVDSGSDRGPPWHWALWSSFPFREGPGGYER